MKSIRPGHQWRRLKRSVELVELELGTREVEPGWDCVSESASRIVWLGGAGRQRHEDEDCGMRRCSVGHWQAVLKEIACSYACCDPTFLFWRGSVRSAVSSVLNPFLNEARGKKLSTASYACRTSTSIHFHCQLVVYSLIDPESATWHQAAPSRPYDQVRYPRYEDTISEQRSSISSNSGQ